MPGSRGDLPGLGKTWQRATLPGGLTNELFAASAPSANDVWAVSLLGRYVLHWTGARWSVARKWKASGSELTGVTAFSPTNVWVFGGPGAYPGLGTWHLHGTTWTKVTGTAAGGITAASALSPANMWAIGSGSAPQDTVVHYNGRTWTQQKSAALAGLQFTGIVAMSRTDIWLSALKGVSPRLVHYNGKTWRRLSVPGKLFIGRISGDGRGGLWLTADNLGTAQGYLLHRSTARAWSRYALPHLGDASQVALIPGSTSGWAAGTDHPSASGDATVWAHGSAG